MKDFSLDFVCPSCKAQPGEKCMVTAGAPREGPHPQRKWIAEEFHRILALAEADGCESAARVVRIARRA
jgi:hypothetical protein